MVLLVGCMDGFLDVCMDGKMQLLKSNLIKSIKGISADITGKPWMELHRSPESLHVYHPESRYKKKTVYILIYSNTKFYLFIYF